ncbi:UNVERIFIED_CONTAM: hypothetical protein PYX00_003729 [Menopon gallinae]|uniref:Innexin n=1 Tax=Menopon gallinae TaxID=328185 RepID=A0AAW2I344_9NEOP
MLKIAEALKSNLNFKVKKYDIDNSIFKLHYRITFWMLMCGVAIVCAHEYIGERIRCLVPDSKLAHVVETFCFFTSTYTVVRHTNRSVINRQIPHPGVGPDVDDEEIIRHSYYQWVPFFLFFQGLCFYLPHFLWRTKEGGRLKALVEGFDLIGMLDQDVQKRNLEKIQLQFKDRLFIYRGWTGFLITCEFLNLVNLIFQIYLTDVFLGYQFMELGVNVFWDEAGDEYNPLDVVFPKMTKCTFKKYGSSGTIEYHDTLCVMALNVINEKTFIVLWYWYIVLFILTVLMLLWRLISFFCHFSTTFNVLNYSFATHLKLNKTDLITVIRNLSFSEWMFLRYLASNMDGRMFRDLLRNLALSFHCPPVSDETDMLLPPRKDDSYIVRKDAKNV